MKKFLFGIILTITVLLVYKQCTAKPVIVIKESSQLIQEQLKNVSKLVVTEGHFSEVYNYENSKEIFGDYLTAEKKALVVVNAAVTISYDLKGIKYNIDEASKTLEIIEIPKQEINLSPDLEYYDIQSDFLNPFEAEDYNQIKETVKASILKKIEKSSLKTNAENRLISELSNFFILTKSLGWKLVYKSTKIDSQEDFNTLLF